MRTAATTVATSIALLFAGCMGAPTAPTANEPTQPSLLVGGGGGNPCLAYAYLACHGPPTFGDWLGDPYGGGSWSDADDDFERGECPENDPRCVLRDLRGDEHTKMIQALQLIRQSGQCGFIGPWVIGRLAAGYVKVFDSNPWNWAGDVHWRPLFGPNDTKTRYHIWAGTFTDSRGLARNMIHEA